MYGSLFLRAIAGLQSISCLSFWHPILYHDAAASETAISLLSFGPFEVLGPFQIGTREAPWGNLPYGSFGPQGRSVFFSSLAKNGTVFWADLTPLEIKVGNASVAVSLTTSFPDVDWSLLQEVYGWAARQYQALVRGQIIIAGNQTVDILFYTDYVLEFWLDGIPYFGGDFYGFRKAPAVLHLQPGTHQLELRLIRDVRAMGGGKGPPTINVKLEAKIVSGSLGLDENKPIISDVVDGILASPWGSVTVRNSGRMTVEITGLEPYDSFDVKLWENKSLSIAAGQTRPIIFNLDLRGASNASSIDFMIHYKQLGSQELSTLGFNYTLINRQLHDPHKVTHLHPGGIVSYAVLKAPFTNVTCPSTDHGNVRLPVLLQLHGAGLEAESDTVAHALDSVHDLCSWILFPTGVTSWSGDDWHNWGFADVEAAISAIPAWISRLDWKGPNVNTERWLVSGHSNGGQGAWYILTHHPDRVLAAAPVSGYLSIPTYVNYQLWRITDPRRSAILFGSLNSYRHELLIPNSIGIPIFQQHGGEDDNVPVYHSRFMSQLLREANWRSTYLELPGEGHWFDGVMTTQPLRNFYYEHLNSHSNDSTMPQNFTIVVANPSDTGSKADIRVIYLDDPGQFGKLDVSCDRSRDLCIIQTSNIIAFDLGSHFQSTYLQVDGKNFTLNKNPLGSSIFLFNALRGETRQTMFRMDKTMHVWNIVAHVRDEDGDYIIPRRGRQLGSLDAILRSQGRFEILHQGTGSDILALQISRNFFQYYSADSEIFALSESPTPSASNRIVVIIGSTFPNGAFDRFPIKSTQGETLSIRDSEGLRREYSTVGGLGAIFLRPLERQRLELVIWGTDIHTASMAARLVPTITGTSQPDFIVLSKACMWKGVDGVVAMGFFDITWRVSKSSFFL